MKRYLLVLILLCASAGARAQRVVCDVAYRPASDDRLIDSLCRLDLFLPEGDTPFPTLIWFHGGGLAGGRKEIPEALKNRGFAVAGVGYRLVPQVKVEECIADAAAAAAWVIGHIAEYGGDPRKIFVAGHSAGGYLTSMIGMDKRWLAPFGIDPDTAFMALIPYSGQAITHFARRDEMGMSDKQPLVDDLAPLYHVRSDCPPVLILSGDRELEMLGRYEENAYLWRMFRVAGHPDVQLMEFDGFTHGSMAAPGHLITVKYIRERLRRAER